MLKPVLFIINKSYKAQIMTTNFELQDILGVFKNFEGVFSLDEFTTQKTPLRKGCYIVNTENKPISGHWLLITVKKNNIEIFDSLALGEKLLPTSLINFCKRYSKINTSQIQIQNTSSLYCGLYCISRFLSLILKQSLIQFTQCFSKDTTKNYRQLSKVIKIQCKKIIILGSNILK